MCMLMRVHARESAEKEFYFSFLFSDFEQNILKIRLVFCNHTILTLINSGGII